MARKYSILRTSRRRLPAADVDFIRYRESVTAAPTRFAEGADAEPEEATIEAAELTGDDVSALARDPTVAVVAPVMPLKLISPFEAPPPPPGVAPWGIAAVKADQSKFDGNGIVVAILDTGIDRAHAAFEGLELVEQDFTGDGNGDQQGHGTHCAGTVFGRDVGGTRIGIARGVTRALIGKVMGNDGRGSSEALYRAMTWAINNGARVISMSLGFDYPGLVQRFVGEGWPPDLATSVALEAYRANLRLFDDLMRVAETRIAVDGGALVVAAAGNESRTNVNPEYKIGVSLPAAAAGVLSVGALGEGAGGLGVAYFSNTGVEISAPGVAILSAKRGGGLVSLSGTSMATPHVAGVAALWWQAVKAGGIPATARNVSAKIIATANRQAVASNVVPADCGVGLVTAP